MGFNLGDLVEYQDYRGIVDFIDTSYIVIRGCVSSTNGNPPRLLIFPQYQDKVNIIEKTTLSNDEVVDLLKDQKYSCPIK
jgi:hypothetical protein